MKEKVIAIGVAALVAVIAVAVVAMFVPPFRRVILTGKLTAPKPTDSAVNQ